MVSYTINIFYTYDLIFDLYIAQWLCDLDDCKADFYEKCLECLKSFCIAHAAVKNHYCSKEETIMSSSEEISAPVSSHAEAWSQWPSKLAQLYNCPSNVTEIEAIIAGQVIRLAAFHYTLENTDQFVNDQGRNDLCRSYIDVNEQLLLYRYTLSTYYVDYL
jgi:hypothetical protein